MDDIEQLPQEDVEKFFHAEHHKTGELKRCYERMMESHSEKEAFWEYSGDALPLSVWAQKGFDADYIKANSSDKDITYNPQVGECYRVKIQKTGSRGSKGTRTSESRRGLEPSHARNAIEHEPTPGEHVPSSGQAGSSEGMNGADTEVSLETKMKEAESVLKLMSKTKVKFSALLKGEIIKAVPEPQRRNAEALLNEVCDFVNQVQKCAWEGDKDLPQRSLQKARELEERARVMSKSMEAISKRMTKLLKI